MSAVAENYEAQRSSVTDSSPPKPSGDSIHPHQTPSFPQFPSLQNGGINMLHIMYPVLVPALATAQNPEQVHRGPGIYAVPVAPFMETARGFPTNSLIPLTYSTPTRSATSDAGATGGQQNQVGGPLQQPAQQLPAQRQIVVRRFQLAFQLDLLLILKLAAVVFIFNQDGSRQRLAVLVFFAIIVYLYQTGALTPLMQWVSQAMQRAAAPPRPARPAARVEPVRPGNENVAGPVAAMAADGQPAAENADPPANDVNHIGENEVAPEAAVDGGNHWWGIVKEIQMVVFGFITSLLPGFHHMDQA